MDKLILPKKEELIARLISVLDDEEATEEETLSALKALKRHDKKKAIEKAMQMYELGIKRVPVTDILLSLIPEKRVDKMARFKDGEFVE